MDYLAIVSQTKSLYSQAKKASEDGKLTTDEAKGIGRTTCNLGLLLLGSEADAKCDLKTGVADVLSNAEAMARAKKATLPQVLAIVKDVLLVTNSLLAPSGQPAT